MDGEAVLECLILRAGPNVLVHSSILNRMVETQRGICE